MSMAQQFMEAREAAIRSAHPSTADNVHDITRHAAVRKKNSSSAAVTVLTQDPELYEAIRRAVLHEHQVFAAQDAQQACELAEAGKCAILVTDQSVDTRAFESLGKQLRRHEPALVTVAVGRRGQDDVLLALVEAETVDRFIIKPFTPALASVVVEAAAREHSLRTANHDQRAVAPPAKLARLPERSETPPSAQEVIATPVPQVALPQSRSRYSRPSWVLLLVAALAAGVAVWWLMLQRMPDINPHELIATNLSAGHSALQEGRYLEPADRSAFHFFNTVLALDPANGEARAAIAQIAEAFADSAAMFIAQGHYAQAVGALDSIRRVQPQSRRLPQLEAQLRNSLDINFPQIPLAKVEEPRRPLPVVERRVAPPAPLHPTPVLNVAPPPPAESPLAAQSVVDSKEPDLITGPLLAAVRDAPIVPIEPDIDLAMQPARIESAAPPQAGSAVPPENEPALHTPPPAVLPAPVLVRMVEPEYPSEARLRGIEGWVDLSFVVAPSGKVTQTRIEDSSMRHLFARPALLAVRQWKYQPRTTRDTSQRTWVRVQFRLTQ